MPDYYLKLITFIGALAAVMLAWILYGWWKKQKLLATIEATPLPESYKTDLEKIPHFDKLSEEEKMNIGRSIRFFIQSKEFIGNKIEITDEIRVTIAFYACLLLLHLDLNNCYDNLKTIIIYPHAMITDQLRANGGIYSKEEMILSGQSANDTVVISWHDAKREAYHMRHENVIIHEFAHEIDFMDGEVDGVPPLALSKYHEWSQVMYEEFKKLNDVALKEREWGKYKTIGSYAASNEAEFFAVITERFFESPRSLKHHFPDLYRELSDFYRIDPLIFEPTKTV